MFNLVSFRYFLTSTSRVLDWVFRSLIPQVSIVSIILSASVTLNGLLATPMARSISTACLHDVGSKLRRLIASRNSFVSLWNRSDEFAKAINVESSR